MKKYFLSKYISFGIKWYIITRVLAYVIALFAVFNINKSYFHIKREFMEILYDFDVLHQTIISIKPYLNMDVLFRLAVVYSMPGFVYRHTLAISEGLAYLTFLDSQEFINRLEIDIFQLRQVLLAILLKLIINQILKLFLLLVVLV